ncbi:polysaccharide biosynthesis protein [Lentilactobacillus sp. IMAU92037]|uniref:putative polysaccharide biosynthesis protein n=1 Tax=Lentilactobacillus TaxID=2767893 RepID=UPI001C26B9EE|nr:MULTISPECIES: polysaccharide biosynthesis protein [Lentilactobacillus]MBU9788342.1 polysaccharide biosynthesis protein [Lentilactobacillus dabitei]MBV0929270.1 polysaccharide biosynthesis protein [Lentilactobacillus dabitei]MDM7517623.1 polysaccharide biosynthesis protein [Lentilactobacillus sp. TOM.63]
MNKKIMSGSFWLSFGSIFSRVLGIVYLIPWLYMIGSPEHKSVAMALFNASYNPYGLFIALGTAGFPSAIARRVAIYNGENKFLDSKQLAKVGSFVMLMSGILCGAILWIIAPIIAKNSPVVSASSAVTSIRVLVPAIVILPSMSSVRGWFQGNQDLKPYGVSQLWEQFIRIVFILVSTYVVIYVLHRSYIEAVYLSVMAAFVGAVASYLYLGLYYKKQSANYVQMAAKSKPYDLSSIQSIFKMIAYESIPFVIVGSGITLSQLIDQLFFKQVMEGVQHYSAVYTQYIYTLFSANPTKITTVVVSLALAVAETTLPLLAHSLAAHDPDIGKLIFQNINMLLFTLLPIVAVLGGLSYEINGIFFSFSTLGGDYLFWNIIQSLILGLAINGLTLLQALHYSKKAMYYLFVGLIAKLLFQPPLVILMQGFGAILSTAIGFGFVILLSYGEVRREFHVPFGKLRVTVLVNIVFFAIVIGLAMGIHQLYVPAGLVMAFIFCCVFGLVTLLIYLFMANHTGLSGIIFDRKIGYKYFRYKHFQ